MFIQFIKKIVVRELIIIAILCVLVFIIAARFDTLEFIVETMEIYEEYELDEFITVAIFLSFALSIFAFRRWNEATSANHKLIETNAELQDALAHINQLKNMLPICSSCKKIRDDEGNWHQLESYIHSQTGTEFSHSMCPDCMEQWYPNLKKRKASEN